MPDTKGSPAGGAPAPGASGTPAYNRVPSPTQGLSGGVGPPKYGHTDPGYDDIPGMPHGGPAPPNGLHPSPGPGEPGWDTNHPGDRAVSPPGWYPPQPPGSGAPAPRPPSYGPPPGGGRDHPPGRIPDPGGPGGPPDAGIEPPWMRPPGGAPAPRPPSYGPPPDYGTVPSPGMPRPPGDRTVAPPRRPLRNAGRRPYGF